MISYLQAVNVIKIFADDHLQINRFDFEFKEQMQNLATLNEAYPFLYVVPVASDTIQNVNEFDVEIYCVDRLQKDRTNVNYVISDTNQILNDLVLWLEEGQDDIEIVGTATQTPINNDLLDYVGGWVLRVRLQVEKIGLCEIPLGGEMPPPPTCENATFQNSDESFVVTIASGDTYTSEDITVNVYDQDENLLGQTTSPSNIDVNVVVEIPPCPPSEVEAKIYNTNEELIVTQTVNEENPNITFPDTEIVLKDSGGATISTTDFASGVSNNLTAPDGLININGSSVGNVKSNGTRNLFVKLNGTNSGTYDGVDTINVTSSDAWVRPTGWLPLDMVGTGTQNFSGLFAVYETQKNVCTIQITTGTHLINWGDGTTQSATSGTLYTKVYDYATLSSPILVDEFGYNYKMAVVNIPMTSATIMYIDRNTTATLINNGRSLNWLDVAVDCSTLTTFVVSNQGVANKLQRLLIYNVGATLSGSAYFKELVHLRVLKFPFEKLQTTSGTFSNYFGNVRDENNDPININLSINTSTLFNFFSNSFLTKIGNITAPTSTSGQSMFENNLMLHEVGTISLPLVANVVAMFSACVNLESVVTITITSTCSNISHLGLSARKCKGFTISNCSGITNTNNAFFNMVSMETLILTGMTRGFTIDDCNMSATAIDALFTSLGNAVGSQTINVRRNPGSATCTTSIATSKGYTVVIA